MNTLLLLALLCTHPSGHTGDDSRNSGGVTGSGVIVGGLLYCLPAANDSDPMTCYFQGSDSFPRATGANRNGGDIEICGGIGTHFFTIVNFANCAGDTMGIYVDSVGFSSSFVEGVDWFAGASNEEASLSLATAIANAPGITTAYNNGTANVYIKPNIDVCDFRIYSPDLTCATYTEGDNGAILIPSGKGWAPSLAFQVDADGTGTGIYRAGTNQLAIASNGILRINITPSGIELNDAFSSDVEIEGELYSHGNNTKGARTEFLTKTESVTFPGGGAASQVTIGSIIVDGGCVVGASGRVTIGNSGACTSFDAGIATDTNLFGSTISPTLSTTFTSTSATANFSCPALANDEIIITANGGNCATMKVALTVHYIEVQAATSN